MYKIKLEEGGGECFYSDCVALTSYFGMCRNDEEVCAVKKRLYGANCGPTRPKTHQLAISFWAGPQGGRWGGGSSRHVGQLQ
jgi:hypothetical protein